MHLAAECRKNGGKGHALPDSEFLFVLEWLAFARNAASRFRQVSTFLRVCG